MLYKPPNPSYLFPRLSPKTGRQAARILGRDRSTAAAAIDEVRGFWPSTRITIASISLENLLPSLFCTFLKFRFWKRCTRTPVIIAGAPPVREHGEQSLPSFEAAEDVAEYAIEFVVMVSAEFCRFKVWRSSSTPASIAPSLSSPSSSSSRWATWPAMAILFCPSDRPSMAQIRTTNWRGTGESDSAAWPLCQLHGQRCVSATSSSSQSSQIVFQKIADLAKIIEKIYTSKIFKPHMAGFRKMCRICFRNKISRFRFWKFSNFQTLRFNIPEKLLKLVNYISLKPYVQI